MSQLLEEILSRDNMMLAYKRVKANKGASGIDGVTVEEIDEYVKAHWVEIREQIRKRKYQPQPVRRVEIPKPNGGIRNLGIPTVIDRIIEQAIAQVLTPIAERLNTSTADTSILWTSTSKSFSTTFHRTSS